MSSSKLHINSFLKVFTNAGVPVAKAMGYAAKIFPKHNTPEQLAKVTNFDLVDLGFDAKEDRKQILKAISKAGFKAPPKAGGSEGSGSGSSAGSSSTQAPGPSKKKRKRDDVDPSEAFKINEVLDEKVLQTKWVFINRAPVMTAWAMVVAERIGFKREEALSIASVYTEMNAISKGVSIGVFEAKKAKGVELARDQSQSQPYLDLMGRRIPLLQAQETSQWRALMKGEPVEPSSGYGYLTRSFKQTLPFVIGALRLLAESHSATELERLGFSLYADFRPDMEGWGKAGKMRCERILSLRKKRDEGREEGGTGVDVSSVIKHVDGDVDDGSAELDQQIVGDSERPEKKIKEKHEDGAD